MFTAPSPTEFDDLPGPHKALVNAACERFEAALQAGQAGTPDAYLDSAPPALHSILLRELLALECEYRGAVNNIRHVGPYSVAGELGRGGFGVVYRAIDSRDGATYALKVPHPSVLVDPAFHARFRREAEAAARLEHPSIVRIHEVKADGPASYLAAEYVAGPTLAEWIAERMAGGTPVGVREAAELVAALADAVQHAHDRGVLHRDLKPSNVLLEGRGVGGPDSSLPIPKITDFGLARLGDGNDELSRSGQIVGTPAYMAPEQVAGRRRAVSPRTDVYALGIILFELLAGRPPFAGAPGMEMLIRVLRDDPPDLRQFRRDVPADLEAVCFTCLEKNPDRRYASARDLANDLRRFLAGDRTRVRPPGRLRRAGRWLRRRPFAGAAIAAAVFLLGAAGIHTYRVEVVNAALTAALHERDQSNRQYRRAAYAGSIRRIETLLDRGDDPEAHRLLAEWEQQPGENLRGWEWYYLSRRTHRGQLACWNAGVTYTLAFRPDGGALAAAGADGLLRVWNPDTGKELSPPRPHPADIGPVIWSPDGKWLASACDDGVVRIWPVADESAIELTGHTDKIKDIALSPDRRALASASKDGTVRLWDTADWSRPGRVLVREEVNLRSVAFGPGETILVSGTYDNHLKVWDAATGRLLRSLPAHPDPLTFIRAAPETPRFVTAARDVFLWEPSATEPSDWRHRGLPGLTDRVRDVALSSGGQTLAIAGDSGATVWSWEGPRFQCRVYGHQGLVHAVALHPDCRHLATAGGDGTVRLWDLRAVPVSNRYPLAGDPMLLAMLPNQGVCVTANPAGWRAETWENDGGPEAAEHEGPITGAAIAPGGAAILTIDSRGRARQWPLAGGEGGICWSLTDDPMPHVRELAVSPDGRRIATAVGGEVALVEAGTGRRVATLPGIKAPSVLVFSPDSHTLATEANDRCVHLWDTATGARRIELSVQSGMVKAVAFAPNGRTLASAGDDHAIRLWDLAGRSTGFLSGHKGTVLALAFSPDGRTLASTGADGACRVWQLATGSEMLTFSVEDRPITHVAFSADGRYLAFAGPPSAAHGEGFLEIHDCGGPLAVTPHP